MTRWRTPGHCDPEYAKDSPYGGTIIHGFHMVALLSHFYRDTGLWPIDGSTPLNYGLDSVRFLAPVIVGSRVRLHSKLISFEPKGTGQFLMKAENTIEIEGSSKPALIAESLALLVPGPDAQH